MIQIHVFTYCFIMKIYRSLPMVGNIVRSIGFLLLDICCGSTSWWAEHTLKFEKWSDFDLQWLAVVVKFSETSVCVNAGGGACVKQAVGQSSLRWRRATVAAEPQRSRETREMSSSSSDGNFEARTASWSSSANQVWWQFGEGFRFLLWCFVLLTSLAVLENDWPRWEF